VKPRWGSAAFAEFQWNCESAVNTNANIPTPANGASEEVTAVMLVGGLGTRLQPVLPSTPKALARIGTMPFLELLILQLRSQGVRRVVMCTGYRADQIEQELGDGQKWGVAIEHSREPGPLGTAGAVKLAEPYLRQDRDFLVMNGDSFLELDFRQFIRFHRKQGGLISMAVRKVLDCARYGTVQVNASHQVVGFSEKTGAQAPGIVNGGVYMFNRAVLEQLVKGPASLERDVFPRLLDRGMYALEQHGMFIDIGTPEDYARAQALSRNLYKAALPGQ
jgi:NDP-sugar pyrophosphorylase family protein